MTLRGLFESAERAAALFRVFEDGEPDLVDLGIPAVRSSVGGMFPGNLVILAAGQNCGKSSMLLEMGTASLHKGGVVSLEDGEDVWGARLLAKYSGVPPTRIRTKHLSDGDYVRLAEAMEILRQRDEKGLGPLIEYQVGAPLDRAVQAVHGLADKGCRWVALDYLQKIRGVHTDRRVEVGIVLGRFQAACAERNMVPVLLSQLNMRLPGQEPFPHHLKESGDIEAEARLIIMLWRDPRQELTLRGKVAKSTFGGGGRRFEYEFTGAESLSYVPPGPFGEER